MSKALEKNDLPSALEDLGASLQQAQPDLNFQLYANFNLKELGSLAKIQLYRIVQELLANVLKHAQARNVTLQLLENEGGHAQERAETFDKKLLVVNKGDADGRRGVGHEWEG